MVTGPGPGFADARIQGWRGSHYWNHLNCCKFLLYSWQAPNKLATNLLLRSDVAHGQALWDTKLMLYRNRNQNKCESPPSVGLLSALFFSPTSLTVDAEEQHTHKSNKPLPGLRVRSASEKTVFFFPGLHKAVANKYQEAKTS